VETETGRQLSALAHAGAFALLALLLLAALALVRPLARRLRIGDLLAFLTLASIALIIAFTLRPQDIAPWLGDVAGGGAPVPGSLAWITDSRLWDGATRLRTGWILNAALFLPAGLTVGLATGRPLRTLLALVGLSFVLEVVQGLTFVGSADPSDLVANSVGAAAGAAIAAGTRLIRPREDGEPEGRRTWRVLVTLAVVVLVAIGSVGVTLAYVADARRADLRAELSTAFEGSTSAQIAQAIDSDDGFDELLTRVSVRPDYIGRVGSSSQLEARYTTQFLGLYRCVFVRWDPSGFGLRSAAGSACSTFRDSPAPE
jgi:VanZ like family